MNLGRSIKLVKSLVYDPYGFTIERFKVNKESKEYEACTYRLNGKQVACRTAKITPKKIGQFVAIWKRNSAGITVPHDDQDQVDFLVINVHDQELFGQFVFPNSVLIEKGIFSSQNKAGKRGMRVYPPWDQPNNKQAIRTQKWQVEYFLPIKGDNTFNADLARRLYN